MITCQEVNDILNIASSSGSFADPRDGMKSALTDLMLKKIKEEDQARMGAIVNIKFPHEKLLDKYFSEEKGMDYHDLYIEYRKLAGDMTYN